MPSLSALALSSRPRASRPVPCPAVAVRQAEPVRARPSRKGWKLLSLLAGTLLIALATLTGHTLRPLGSEAQPHQAASRQLDVVDTAGARAFRIQPEQALLVSLNLHHGVSELGRIHDESLRDAQGMRYDSSAQQLHVLTRSGWQRYDARRLQRLADSAQGTALSEAANVSDFTRKPQNP
ncbi:MAG: hypothetical protein QM776_07605 [Rhodocyclaceae bacterium]